ncbi:uncharacterized protein LOC123541211 [Mercenaria mercenaria]|uniref:uncharacterized protein LOC123541211 n=1 Tax=Mercenaria mercenaria TaxID=6596 RepID=UPI001E1E02DE|nr:uncharacterized protein LOC123541211 [Mercenaria mercenaria]
MKMHRELAQNIFHLLLVLSAIDLYCAYRVEVTVKDGGTLQAVSEFEIVNHDNPPFETDSEDTVYEHGKNSFFRQESSSDGSEIFLHTDQKVIDGVNISGFLGNLRHKRSLDRLPEKCVRNAEDSDLSNHAVTVEIGETIHLPCHDCREDKHEMFESLQWLKLYLYPNSNGLYHIKEVVPDLHDEEKVNRITLTLDHTLVLKKVQMSDTGSYFCIPVDRSNNFMNLRLKWNELQEYIARESHMRYFFHVDVIDLKHADTVDVSSYSNTKPLKPEVIPILNIEITTRWHAWTSCSVCGDDGIRKRMGICVVKKHNYNKEVNHDYLRHILNFAKNGIPCQSQFLRDFQQEPWLQKPNQIQIEECNVPCRASISRRKRGITSMFSRSEIEDKEKQDKIDKKNAKKKAKKKSVRVGSYFILKCPGISLTKTINWVNGTKLVHIIKIQKFSKNRITIDMFGNLHFKAAVLSDSGIYSCWKKKKMKFKYEVKVKEDRSAEIRRYTVYLCISFIGDFAVFFILTIIKYCQRRVQHRRSKKAKQIEEESGESSGDDDETSSSSGTSDSD